ncbi:MAG: protein kinase [Anaerolineae bacterium]|nr:protein kinase [Anaerolineae bacterium]
MDIGSTLGHYLIQSRISSSELDDVYRGYQQSLDRYVIIRVFKGLAGQTNAQKRLAQAFKDLEALRHKNILTILDYGCRDDLVYCVTNDVSSTSLKERRKSLSFDEAIDISMQIGQALSAAHKAGIVHGYVNPENILFDETGQPLLTNFETGAVTSQYPNLFSAEQDIKASEYVSPEQKQGDPPDLYSDIYALGKLLEEYVVNAQVPGIKKRARQIQDVVQRATHQSPRKRFSNVEQMLSALSITDDDTQPRIPAKLKIGKKALVWGLVVALVLLVIGGIALAPIQVSNPIATAWAFLFPTQTPIAVWTPTLMPTRTPEPTLSPTPLPTSTLAPTPTPELTLPPTSSPTSTLPPTSTSSPTPTPSATPTATPTFTDTPTATPTPPVAVANLASSIFEAPLDNSRQLGIVEAKESVPILGRANDQLYGKWLYIRNSQAIEGFAYAPRFTYTADWQSLEIITPTVTVIPTPKSTPTGLVIAPGTLKIEHVWSAAVCNPTGGWTAYFEVRISGGDGKNYKLYWNTDPVSFVVKADNERDVAVIQFPGDRSFFVGTVWVESGGQRVGQDTSLGKPVCAN